jgi:quercetin dioxygenase-like cupin family protein
MEGSPGCCRAMNANDTPWIDICPGIRRRTITTGKTMYQMRAELEAGCQMPVHSHQQEQIAHIVSGRVRFTVNGQEVEVRSGESLYFASNVPHGVIKTVETAVVIDTFSPPRDDYLALDEKARRGE